MTSERMRATYDTIAASFAEQTARRPVQYEEVGRRFLALLPVGSSILEVGCGAGRDMAWLEAQGTVVTGVDLSPGMLAEARRLVRGPLLEMDMRHLDFPDSAFGGIWCMASLLHLPKAEAPRALAEMRRVLVPAGVLALTIQEGEGEVWESEAYGHPVERFFARYSRRDAERMLAGAGFLVLESERADSARERPRMTSWLSFLARAGPPATGKPPGRAAT
ncbi:MAG: class I SAM-dependent methyltransferase [Chloroflexia bacterium]|nr:class I SAM-dependent methyltransferase [Chloroflexia bacterium]